MFEDRTRDNIKAEMLEDIQTSTGLTALEGGFADHVLGPVSVKLEEAYGALRGLLAILTIDETSGGLIDLAAGNLGLARKEGSKAYAALTLQGTPGAMIPAGTVFLTDGGLEFSLDADVTLDGNGTGKGYITAEAVGAAYNIKPGELTRMYVNRNDLESFSNDGAVGGADPESDKSLSERVDAKLQTPATSGNPAHIREWAMEVDGVTYAKVVSLAHGNGTVGVTLVGENLAAVDQAIVTAVAENINTKRPVGIEAAPYVQSAVPLPVNITAAPKLDAGVTPSAVIQTLRETLEKHFAVLVETKYKRNYEGPEEDEPYTLSYNRVATMLMTTPGVLDYTTLTINGAAENLTIAPDQVPVLGEVSVT